ncbi:MAG TPA: DNA replication/repair protein RecF, partial [Paracoccaceae bacterium]|nr:DNA replication/repair protein RecF [Paracoccaceae bacterium]
HFRSYRAAVLEAGGESVALYGPNGAGKTNVLEAASLLVPGRGLRRAATDELIRTPERLGWRIAAEVATGEGTGEIVTAAEGAEVTRRSVTIDDKPAPQTALGGLVRQVWLTPAMDRLWSEGPGDRRRFLDRITLGFAPGHAETSVAYEKAMRERNRLLKDGRDGRESGAWLDALEARMARAGASIARARAEALGRLIAAQDVGPAAGRALFPKADLAILGAMESRFAQVIRDCTGSGAASHDLDAAEGDEAAGLTRALEEGRARDAAAGRTLEGPHRSDLDAVYADKAMPARACSTGEQKALLISLCLANARALADATGAAPILLLDEVAAHLDADRRRALYAEIHALGAQALATGTSEALFDGFEARRVSVSEAGGLSHESCLSR